MLWFSLLDGFPARHVGYYFVNKYEFLSQGYSVNTDSILEAMEQPNPWTNKHESLIWASMALNYFDLQVWGGMGKTSNVICQLTWQERRFLTFQYGEEEYLAANCRGLCSCQLIVFNNSKMKALVAWLYHLLFELIIRHLENWTVWWIFCHHELLAS